MLALARRLALPAIIGVGFALRLGLLATFPLRPDEALYGDWARSVFHDPFFLHVWPDKPPLYLWLLAGSFALLGPSAEAARWLNIVAATLTIPLVAVGAGTLWQSRRAGWIAALVFACNPYAISFAPTAYTDTTLVLWGTAALVAALRGRAVIAGLLLAAAIMTKQQGLLYVPLVVALLAMASPLRTLHRRMGGLWVGAAALLVPILWWDSRRWTVAPSPWDLAQHTYAPLTWVDPAGWPVRAEAWANQLQYLAGDGLVWAGLLVALAAASWLAVRTNGGQPRATFAPAALLLWSGAFLLLHLVTTVQIWDRYLLPLAPILALLVAGPLAHAWKVSSTPLGQTVGPGLLLAVLLSLARPAWAAAQGQLPIGGDRGDYAGLTEALAWVETANPGPLLLYHQALGWQFRFYLHADLQPPDGAPAEIPPRIDLRWFPSAAYLADNAAKQPFPPKYLILPDWATPRDLALQLRLRGLEPVTRLQHGHFTVVEIVQPPRPLCDWCLCRTPAPLALPAWRVAP
jgi:4-amino-4-deoxy-L-arabinose transferase-like glycosyltransferase